MNRGASSVADAANAAAVTAAANGNDAGVAGEESGLRRSSRVRRPVQPPFGPGIFGGGSSTRSKVTLAESSEEDAEESHLDQVSLGDGGTLRMFIHPCAAALMQFHAHLARTEVIGYLGGFARDDGTVHVLEAFPAICVAGNVLSRTGRSAYREVEMDPASDVEVRGRIVGKGLNVVGWYHSHPDASFTVEPSHVDIENQFNYQQYIFKGVPFVAAILAPYNEDLPDYRGDMAAFYVGDGNPLRVPYSVEYGHVQGEERSEYRRHLRAKVVPDEALEAEAVNLIMFYSKFRQRVHLSREWRPGVTFLEKLRACLQALLPKIPVPGERVTGNKKQAVKSGNKDGMRVENVNGVAQNSNAARAKAENGSSEEIAALTANASIVENGTSDEVKPISASAPTTTEKTENADGAKENDDSKAEFEDNWVVNMGPVSVDEARVANEQLALLFSGLLKMADDAWEKPPERKKGKGKGKGAGTKRKRRKRN